ncbi:c-type cytochrome [Solirhodobacter olei]|uniref:c-type cytochrome n=1 Tax=Solirhodobacter olei TaxID=2493082 RepID=UPI000FD9B2E9|nr:c-type cytochrome [Solirhodobacter olei]
MANLDKCLKVGLALLAVMTAPTARADNHQLERGRYLVTIIGCTDCHTPGALTGKPDTARFLGGANVGFQLPGLGTFVPPNLTPDKTTGLGDWTKDQIITAFTKGKDPEGRTLAPTMPWRDFSNLTKTDADAIATYLMSLKPVSHAVPEPFGPDEKVPILVMKVVPGSGMPKE